MKKDHRVVTIAIAAVAVAVVALFASRPSKPRSTRSNALQTAPALPNAAAGTAAAAKTAAAAAEQDRELRAAILRGSILAAQAEAPQPTDPVAQAVEILDERMEIAAPNPENTASMTAALQAIIRSGVLGETSATLLCGASMCRIDLNDTDSARVEQASQALASRTPKLFGSTLVFQRGASGRAVYLSTSATDLNLDPSEPQPSASAVAGEPPPER